MSRLFLIVATCYIVLIGDTINTVYAPYFTILLHTIVGTTTLAWMLNLTLRRRGWPQTSLDAPLLLYVILLAITTIAADDVRIAADRSWRMLVHVIWFYMLVDMMRHGKQRWLFDALFMTTGILVGFSGFEFVSWYFGLGFADYEQGWFGVGTGIIPPTGFQFAIALGVSTILGNYMLINLPLIIAWAITAIPRDLRIGLWLLALGVFIVLIGTGSRGALGAAVASGGTFLAFQLMSWPRTRTVFREAWVLPTIVIGVVLIAGLLVFYATQSDSTSDQRRVDMWESSIEIIEDQPIVGVGVGRFGVAYRPLRNQAFIQDKIVSAHNLLLNTTAEIGIGGLLLLLWLGFKLLGMWYAHWQIMPRPLQIRYEGILAALVGFGVHSTVDTFAGSPSVLPVLIIVAYVVVGPQAHRPQTTPLALDTTSLQRWVLVGASLFFLSSTIWLATTDIARWHGINASTQIGNRDYATALEHLDAAASTDPHQGVYQLQQGYVLCLLAYDAPEEYLTRAIAFNEEVLVSNPTYDMGMVNLSGLYAQQGNYNAALGLIEQALTVRPDIWQYHFLRGRYLEHLNRGVDARQAYVEALMLQPNIALSPYWTMTDDTLPFRSEAIRDFWPQATPDIQMQIAIMLDDDNLAQQTLDNLGDRQDARHFLAVAYYATTQGDLEFAVHNYTLALQALDVGQFTELASSIYVQRAELHLILGNTHDAETDARLAIFVDNEEGARGYYILALLYIANGEKDDVTINEYLARGVPLNTTFQEYAATVYYATADLNYIPQLQLPSRGVQMYEPWLLLAKRFASDSDPNTDPQVVYDALEFNAPYVQVPIAE